MALCGGCTPTPDEVAETGLSGEPPTSTSESTADPPGPTSDGSATVASADGTGSSSGSSDEAPATTMPVDGTDTTTSGASEGTSSSSGAATESSGDTTTGGTDACHPILAEVLYDPDMGDNNKEWVRLYNPCAVEIVLDAYSLGWGGTSYDATGRKDLVGSMGPGECFVVGGATSNTDNANPMLDQASDFSSDLQNGPDPADGVALFFGAAASIMSDTIPVDAVIYGTSNSSNLLDAENNVPDPHVGDAPEGQSIRRTALDDSWVIEPNPTPNECPAL